MSYGARRRQLKIVYKFVIPHCPLYETTRQFSKNMTICFVIYGNMSDKYMEHFTYGKLNRNLNWDKQFVCLYILYILYILLYGLSVVYCLGNVAI